MIVNLSYGLQVYINQMHNMSPDTLTYLGWVPDLKSWNEDGENERGVLVHGTLISNEEDKGDDEGDHLGVAELPQQS